MSYYPHNSPDNTSSEQPEQSAQNSPDAALKQPKNNNFGNKLSRLILGILVLLLLGAGIIWYGFFIRVAGEQAEVKFVIPEGSSVAAIAAELQQAGVISSPLLFKTYVALTRQMSQLQAGEYTVAQLSIAELVKLLAHGGAATNELRVTLLEGWTSAEMQQYLTEKGLPAHDFTEYVSQSIKAVATTYSPLLFSGAPATASLEGYLFPDTYNVFVDTTSAEIVDKMLQNFAAKMDDKIKAPMAKSPYSFYEILTLASIVEKEVRTPAERRIAAGIFLRRLADGYPLESDATINYVTGKNTTQPAASDLVVESRYNTYKYAGLPPGPIANPGLDAIQAVLEPTATDYYFFLTTPEPEGKAIFSKTFTEHLQNKAKYYP